MKDYYGLFLSQTQRNHQEFPILLMKIYRQYPRHDLKKIFQQGRSLFIFSLNLFDNYDPLNLSWRSSFIARLVFHDSLVFVLRTLEMILKIVMALVWKILLNAISEESITFNEQSTSKTFELFIFCTIFFAQHPHTLFFPLIDLRLLIILRIHCTPSSTDMFKLGHCLLMTLFHLSHVFRRCIRLPSL